MGHRILLICDLDGTLIDSLEDIYLSAEKACKKLSLPVLSKTEVKSALGDGLGPFIERVLQPNSAEEFSHYRDVFLEIYQKNLIEHTKPFPGIEEVLNSLHKSNVLLAIASNKSEKLVKRIVEHFNWQNMFVGVIGGDTTSHKKPGPQPLMLARSMADLDAKHPALMVGDSPQDIEAAKAAHCKAIWASWGYRHEAPAGTDFVLGKPKELLTLIQKHWL